MNKIISIMLLAFVTLSNHGQIIADHRAVDDFENIPAEYISEVKKMMVAFPGESHSAALRIGMELLEAMDATYACNVAKGEAYTDQYVRVENYGWIGEDTWFTWYAYNEGDRPYSPSMEIKNMMSNYYASDHPVTALGFGWCYDMLRTNQSDLTDPDYGVSWYGSSGGGPDGDLGWGLDEDDYALTGNRVSLQSYFGAMEEYAMHSQSNAYGTKMVYTTGPVDSNASYWMGESGYQGHLKHEAIRDYVKADQTRILFDFADILCHDDNGNLSTQTWNEHTYPNISYYNEVPTAEYHISEAGAVRLAKAQWWMLARIAGWKDDVAVDDIEEGNASLQVLTQNDNLIITVNDALISSSIRLYDSRGSLVASKQLDSNSGSFNIAHLPPGIYVVVLAGSNSIMTRKVLV